jgi:hypothetical protein
MNLFLPMIILVDVYAKTEIFNAQLVDHPNLKQIAEPS